MMAGACRQRFAQPLMIATVCALSLVAWAVLWRFGSAPYLQHHPSHEAGLAPVAFFGLFVLGWTAMSIAMMLPSSLPLLSAFHDAVAERSKRVQLLATVVLGYLTAWVTFGVLVYFGGAAIAGVVDALPPISANQWVASGVIVMVAGAFQFSGLKDRCLKECRAPARFVSAHWNPHGRGWQALRLGTLHGVFCVGCCWAIMLLMFVVSSSNLGWMLLLAAVMALEKSTRWGYRLTVPLGVVLLSAGTAMVALE